MSTKKMLVRPRGSSQEKATLWVGRKGLNPEFTSEASERLDQRELLKIKVQKSVSQPVLEIARVLAESLKADVVDIRGRSFILYRQKRVWEAGPKHT